MADTEAPRSNQQDGIEPLFKVWPRVAVVLGLIGTICTYIVTNWSQIEPIVSSGPMVVLFMLLNLILGGVLVYWLVARPLEHRVGKTEGILSRMRERERELGDQITALKVELAKLETRMDMLGKQSAP